MIFTVKLKNHQIVKVPLEELETFLEEHKEQILVQKTEMGKRRTVTESLPLSSNK